MYLNPVQGPIDPSRITTLGSIMNNAANTGNALTAASIAPQMAQAQLSQQQTAANFAPQLAYAQTQEALGHANLYNDLGNYRTTQAGVLNTGGNNTLAQLNRISQTALMTGNYDAYMAAQQASNNYLAQQQSTIQKNLGQGAQAQAGAAKSAAEAVNLGGSGGYVSPQMPIINPSGIIPQGGPVPTNGQPPMPLVPQAGTINPNSIVPSTGLTPQGNSPGAMQNLQTQLNGATGTQGASATPQYANQMNDADIVGAAMNNQLPPLQPISGNGGGIALHNQSINAQKQMDSMQTYPSKLQALYEFYNNPQVQGYVGPEMSKGGLERGLGNIANSFGMAPDSYNQYQQGRTNALLAGEGLSQLAVPGTRSGTLISKNIDQVSPDNVKNYEAAKGQIQQIAMANIQDLTGYIKGTYLPTVRQAAMSQLQAAMKVPVYQEAYKALQAQQNPLGQTQGQTGATPASGGTLTYNPATGEVQ